MFHHVKPMDENRVHKRSPDQQNEHQTPFLTVFSVLQSDAIVSY